MPNRVRLSLAHKCQILIGAAVVLVIAAALSVAWLRLESLAAAGPRQLARQLAEGWVEGQIALELADPPGQPGLAPLPADRERRFRLIRADRAAALAEKDPFVAQAMERFELRARQNELFQGAEPDAGPPYYRYLRAVRRSELPGQVQPAGDAEAEAGLNDPISHLLLIELRDPDAATRRMVSRLYLLAAAGFAGVLAIGAFWLILTRVFLVPVRLLRDVARRVAAGELNIRADINTGDEFEQLARQFNNMLEAQKEKQDQLRSINKSLDLKLDELARSNVSLYEANKIKGEFLANVSHELRTPLNSMIGFAEVLGETLPDDGDPQSEKRRRYVGNILTASRRLLDLINDLLDLAKIEAGRMELNVAPISISDTCEGLVNLIRPQADPRHLVLKQKIDAGVPIVQTDAGKLQQILFNFLSNAVKFTPPGGEVTIAAAALPPLPAEDQPRVRISVSDTGPGIAPEDHERIFEKFTQLDASVTRQHMGTGLGLTISRELADMLQGRIEVDSELGQGATFSVTIPAVLERRSVPLMPELTRSGPGEPGRE
ncbi:MAG: ATP-binding protein [Phycisphaeraceae bacterium]